MEPFEAKYWNMTQLLIWVSTGNRTFVRLAADDRPSHGSYDAIDLIGKAVENGLCRPFREFDDAQDDVLKRLFNGDLGGDLGAWGRRNGKGAHEKIPDREWWGLQIYPAGMAETRLWPERSAPHVGRPDTLTSVRGADDEADPLFWTDVIFERVAVLKVWPDPLDELLHNEQSDSVSEPAAALREGTARALTAPPRDGHSPRPISEAELRRWYHARMKECENAGGRYHSRDEDMRAAREEFGQRVTRQQVRGIRNQLLPNEAKKGGAPWKNKHRRPE